MIEQWTRGGLLTTSPHAGIGLFLVPGCLDEIKRYVHPPCSNRNSVSWPGCPSFCPLCPALRGEGGRAGPTPGKPTVHPIGRIRGRGLTGFLGPNWTQRRTLVPAPQGQRGLGKNPLPEQDVVTRQAVGVEVHAASAQIAGPHSRVLDQ